MAFVKLEQIQLHNMGKPDNAVIAVGYKVLDKYGNFITYAGHQISSNNHFDVDEHPLIMLPSKPTRQIAG